MFELVIWAVYGLFVGSIAKSLVPGDENFGFIKTVILGVVGSYVGGAALYLLGKYEAVSATGIFMGVVGAVVSLMVYNQLSKKNS